MTQCLFKIRFWLLLSGLLVLAFWLPSCVGSNAQSTPDTPSTPINSATATPTAPHPPTSTATALPTPAPPLPANVEPIPLTLVDTTDGNQSYRGTFTITAVDSSYQVVVRSEIQPTFLRFKSVLTPAGRDIATELADRLFWVLFASTANEFAGNNYGYITFYPFMDPKFSAEFGEHTLEVLSEGPAPTPAAYLITKKTEDGQSGEFKIRPYISLHDDLIYCPDSNENVCERQEFNVGAAQMQQNLLNALHYAEAVYERHGIEVTILPPIFLEPELIPEGSPGDETQERILPNAADDEINVILAKSVFSTESGIALGLPASQGLLTMYNAVFIATQRRVTKDGEFTYKALGSTIAHEVGHYLGLLHVSELGPVDYGSFTFTEHDLIPDTRECANVLGNPENPLYNADDYDENDLCKENDNVMRAARSSVGAEDEYFFSEQQIQVLKSSPLYRLD